MLDHIRVTDALSLTSVAAPVYSPACLLDVSSLDARITTDTNFVEGCERGYISYFDPDEGDSDEFEPDAVVALTAPHTISLILKSLFGFLLSLTGNQDIASHIPFLMGWCVGWLSAIAVAQPDEAAIGMLALTSLVKTFYEQNYVRFETPAQREMRAFFSSASYAGVLEW